MFRAATAEQFKDALDGSAASALFRRQLQRFRSFDSWLAMEAAVNDGDLTMSGDFRAPAFCTLILGDLTVDGVIDLQTDFEEGGLFIVIGNATCRHFLSEYAKCSFIDGDLEASDSIVNGFSESSLVVTGQLRTKLFIGADICAEVGRGAVMDYGVGFCLPIGYADAERDAILPRHSESETARIVAPSPNADGYLFTVDDFVDRIRTGEAIFK